MPKNSFNKIYLIIALIFCLIVILSFITWSIVKSYDGFSPTTKCLYKSSSLNTSQNCIDNSECKTNKCLNNICVDELAYILTMDNSFSLTTSNYEYINLTDHNLVSLTEYIKQNSTKTPQYIIVPKEILPNYILGQRQNPPANYENCPKSDPGYNTKDWNTNCSLDSGATRMEQCVKGSKYNKAYTGDFINFVVCDTGDCGPLEFTSPKTLSSANNRENRQMTVNIHKKAQATGSEIKTQNAIHNSDYNAVVNAVIASAICGDNAVNADPKLDKSQPISCVGGNGSTPQDSEYMLLNYSTYPLGTISYPLRGRLEYDYSPFPTFKNATTDEISFFLSNNMKAFVLKTFINNCLSNLP